MKSQPVIAVAAPGFRESGCPYCGYRSGHPLMSGQGTTVWICSDCGRQCFILAEGMSKSTISIGGVHPELQDHPRSGTPSHGKPDKKPEDGGEFFESRGVGTESDLACFVCGGNEELRNNIAAFVQTKEAGERVVSLFQQGARLDYREHEPDHVQVKIGACEDHEGHLQTLHTLTEDGIITASKIQKAIQSK